MKKKMLIGAGLIVIVLAGYMLMSDKLQSAQVEYQLGVVSVGDIEQTVSATGTVSPVTTVEVGTQISGTIDTVMADYNDPVTVGQVLAVLDTVLLRASVLEAEASVERIEALLEEAELDYQRNLSLFKKNLIAESDLTQYQVSVKTHEADLKSAKASLTRARRNLQYAVIRSPIDGIVIQRSVEEGQTVAASLSTPTLFMIAQDLSQMEILADVDESDIGSIQEEQAVRFEVAAYPDRSFTGEVSQIRLQPSTISNVVTYTVVVTAENPEGVLMPGMTATLDFVVEERNDVMTVPARALSFRPSEDVIEQLQKERRQAPESDKGALGSMAGRFAAGVDDDETTREVVWYADSTGRIAPAVLVAGLSDGSTTEVVMSPVLTEGMQVVVSSNGSSSGNSSSSTASQERTSRPPGPGRGLGRGGF